MKSCMVKDSNLHTFKVWNGLMDFSETKYKNFTDMASDSTLLRTYHLSSFRVVSKKNIHNDLKRLLKYFSLFKICACVRLDYFHTIQPIQHYHTRLHAEVYMKAQLSFIMSDIKEINYKTLFNKYFLLLFSYSCPHFPPLLSINVVIMKNIVVSHKTCNEFTILK